MPLLRPLRPANFRGIVDTISSIIETVSGVGTTSYTSNPFGYAADFNGIVLALEDLNSSISGIIAGGGGGLAPSGILPGPGIDVIISGDFEILDLNLTGGDGINITDSGNTKVFDLDLVVGPGLETFGRTGSQVINTDFVSGDGLDIAPSGDAQLFTLDLSGEGSVTLLQDGNTTVISGAEGISNLAGISGIFTTPSGAFNLIGFNGVGEAAAAVSYSGNFVVVSGQPSEAAAVVSGDFLAGPGISLVPSGDTLIIHTNLQGQGSVETFVDGQVQVVSGQMFSDTVVLAGSGVYTLPSGDTIEVGVNVVGEDKTGVTYSGDFVVVSGGGENLQTALAGISGVFVAQSGDTTVIGFNGVGEAAAAVSYSGDFAVISGQPTETAAIVSGDFIAGPGISLVPSGQTLIIHTNLQGQGSVDTYVDGQVQVVSGQIFTDTDTVVVPGSGLYTTSSGDFIEVGVNVVGEAAAAVSYSGDFVVVSGQPTETAAIISGDFLAGPGISLVPSGDTLIIHTNLQGQGSVDTFVEGQVQVVSGQIFSDTVVLPGSGVYTLPSGDTIEVGINVVGEDKTAVSYSGDFVVVSGGGENLQTALGGVSGVFVAQSGDMTIIGANLVAEAAAGVSYSGDFIIVSGQSNETAAIISGDFIGGPGISLVPSGDTIIISTNIIGEGSTESFIQNGQVVISGDTFELVGNNFVQVVPSGDARIIQSNFANGSGVDIRSVGISGLLDAQVVAGDNVNITYSGAVNAFVFDSTDTNLDLLGDDLVQITTSGTSTIIGTTLANGSGITIRREGVSGLLDSNVAAGENVAVVYSGADNSFIIDSTGGGGNASITVDENPPAIFENGALWFDTNEGRMFVYASGASVSQPDWYQTNAEPIVLKGETPPSGLGMNAPPRDGAIWFNTLMGSLFIYDLTTSGWYEATNSMTPLLVSANPPAGDFVGQNIIESTANDYRYWTGSTWQNL